MLTESDLKYLKSLDRDRLLYLLRNAKALNGVTIHINGQAKHVSLQAIKNIVDAKGI